MISEQQYQIIREIARSYKLKSIGVFSSYARGEEMPGSVLDLLIESKLKGK